MAEQENRSRHGKDDSVPVEGEVVVADGQTGRELDKFDRFLIDREAEGGDVAIDSYQAIIEQVLSATSPDDVLTPVEAVKAADVVGIPYLLYGFDMNESEFDAGSPFYASMKMGNTVTGEPQVVNCGHKRVIAQLIKLEEFQQYPYRVMFKEQGKSRKSGSPMLVMVKWQE